MNATPYVEINIKVIERCRNGDRKAYYELYDLYSDAMYNVAMRILNNEDEAKEALQDSFVKAFKNLNKYDSGFSFGVWLRRIVINHSLNILKKKKIKFQSLDEEIYAEEENADNDEITYSVDTIRACILQLPDGYRAVISLFLFEKMGHKEIAEALGISEGTSKSQYNRAKKKLIQLLKSSNPNAR